jgi:hypothetical protein
MGEVCAMAKNRVISADDTVHYEQTDRLGYLKLQKTYLSALAGVPMDGAKAERIEHARARAANPAKRARVTLSRTEWENNKD